MDRLHDMYGEERRRAKPCGGVYARGEICGRDKGVLHKGLRIGAQCLRSAAHPHPLWRLPLGSRRSHEQGPADLKRLVASARHSLAERAR